MQYGQLFKKASVDCLKHRCGLQGNKITNSVAQLSSSGNELATHCLGNKQQQQQQQQNR